MVAAELCHQSRGSREGQPTAPLAQRAGKAKEPALGIPANSISINRLQQTQYLPAG